MIFKMEKTNNVYLEREIDNELLKWKEDSSHKPLLIRGARQVGKSTAVRQLAKTFKYFIEINFEKNEILRKIFVGDLDPYRITRDLSAILSIPVIPGETLLFLDEIQSCESAIKSLRYFYEDFQELHVAAAGSLLEFALKDITSFGVGRIRSLYMYPFSFDEFLNAQGFTGLTMAKKEASESRPLSDPLHQKLIEQVRYFHLIGGMPAAVSKWIETKNFNKINLIHNDLILTYQDDFSKYYRKINPQLIRNTLTTVAGHVCSKFRYSWLSQEFENRQIKLSLEMLTMAGLIIPVTHTSSNGQPLGAEKNEKFRKYIFIDTGLLLRFHHFQAEDILLSPPSDFVNKGNLAEMFVGLELIKYSNPYEKAELFYWQREEKNSQAEVDYVIIRNGIPVPVEVKAGKRGTLQSLYIFLAKKGLSNGIRCALEPFSGFDKVNVFPLYAVSGFAR
jgi:uncharacterized protein